MKTAEVIRLASEHFQGLVGHQFDVIDVAKPVSPDAAVNLAKIISKLSPLVGNLIEFNSCEYLNAQPEFGEFGHWKRQDPGFPDTIFEGQVAPTPGFEIKAWFPLATEITARFKDSQNHFAHDQTHAAILAWLPEFLIYGKPKIVGVAVVSGMAIAKARDDHYHNPPSYLVLEPENTKSRTANLQQTNTNGYIFQGNEKQLRAAEKIVAAWGRGNSRYKPTAQYQILLRELIAKFPYRLDTNFAKIDRIVQVDIEKFKTAIYGLDMHGLSVGAWNRLLASRNDKEIRETLERRFGIKNMQDKVVE